MEVKIDCKEYPYSLEYQKVKLKGPAFHRECLELIFVMEGELEVEMDEETNVLTSGDFMLINAGISHTLQGGENTYIACLYLNKYYYEEYYPYIHGHSFFCKYFEEDNGDDDELYHAIRNYFIRIMIIESIGTEQGADLITNICDIILDVLIIHVEDLQYARKKVSHLKEIDKERMESIAKFMADNWDKQGVTLTDLAKHENLSTTRLSHFWKSMTSITFMATINLYRYNEAKRLLMDGILPISEISELCGYSDEKYLYKTFKEKHNMTPKEYRDYHKSLVEEPDKYEIKSISEIKEVINKYGEKYYVTLDDFSFFTRFPDKIEEEKKLNELYSVITTLSQKVQEQGKVDSNGVVINLGLNNGINIDENDSVKINWEYIYAMALITTTLFKNCSIAVEIEFLGVQGWLDVFKTVSIELEKKMGENFQSGTHLIIRYYGYNNYKDAVDLAKETEEQESFISVTPILNI